MKRPKIAPPGDQPRVGVGPADARPRRRPAPGRLASLVVPLLAVGLLLPTIAEAAEWRATPVPDQDAASQGVTTDWPKGTSPWPASTGSMTGTGRPRIKITAARFP